MPKSKLKAWHKVKVPKAWRPEEGEEIIGQFIGTEIKEGQFGAYKAHLIKLRANNVVYITGTISDSLLSAVEPGMKVKIVFNGNKPTRCGEKYYKDFDIYTEEEIKLRIAQ